MRGLYAAGDAATRELICGGFTGGGSHNAAWAISSGYWSGKSAAEHSRSLGEHKTQHNVKGVGEVVLQSRSDRSQTLATNEVIQAVQAEVFPYEKNYFRTEQGLTESLGRLNHLWQELRSSQLTSPKEVIRAREAAAMVATARWMYSSAIERKETRGMHKHQDYPELDANQQHHLISGGLDQVWVKVQPLESTEKSQSKIGALV